MSRYIWQHPKWPQWKWSEAGLKEPLQGVQRKRDYLAGLAAGLDSEHANRAVAELSTQETVATSAIEGVKLDPDSVRSSIMRRLGLGVAKDREERIGPTVKGVIDILADSTQNPGPLTLERLFAWHTAMFPAGRSGLVPVLVGMLRAEEPMQIVSGSYGRETVHYEAPPRERLDDEIARFLKWVGSSMSMDPTLKACIAHLWFETLHPFEDGNGRLAPSQISSWRKAPVFIRTAPADCGPYRLCFSSVARLITSSWNGHKWAVSILPNGCCGLRPAWIRPMTMRVFASNASGKGRGFGPAIGKCRSMAVSARPWRLPYPPPTQKTVG